MATALGAFRLSRRRLEIILLLIFYIFYLSPASVKYLMGNEFRVDLGQYWHRYELMGQDYETIY